MQDQNGHGSFVAGVVGAVGNNGLGVTGINQVLEPCMGAPHPACRRCAGHSPDGRAGRRWRAS